MKTVALIIGSVRDGSSTKKAADLIQIQLENKGFQVITVDPKELALKFPGQEGYEAESEIVKNRVKGSDAVVLVTPEYDATFSSVIKLLIEYMGYPSVLANKPVHIFGVAAGRIGAVKAIEQLKAVCSSTGMLVLPNAISVPNIGEVFDGNKLRSKDDEPLFLQSAAEILAFFAN